MATADSSILQSCGHINRMDGSGPKRGESRLAASTFFLHVSSLMWFESRLLAQVLLFFFNRLDTRVFVAGSGISYLHPNVNGCTCLFYIFAEIQHVFTSSTTLSDLD